MGILFLLVLVLTKVVVGGESVVCAGSGAVLRGPAPVRVLRGASPLNDTYGTRIQRSLYVLEYRIETYGRVTKGRRNLSCHNVQVLVDCLRVGGLTPRKSETKQPEKEWSLFSRRGTAYLSLDLLYLFN